MQQLVHADSDEVEQCRRDVDMGCVLCHESGPFNKAGCVQQERDVVADLGIAELLAERHGLVLVA